MGFVDIARKVRRPLRFDPERDRMDTSLIARGAPMIRAVGKAWFRASYEGIENIPRQGPALLVGSHGLFAFDGFFLFTEIFHRTGRLPRGLGEHILFLEPLSKSFWTKVGAIEGTPDNALRALEAGHLVNVYPGGARDALKRPEESYRLHWEKSKGFVRVAMGARVPIVLHVGIGTDETYRTLGRLRWTGRVMGNEKYEVPLLLGWGPLPRPVKLTYYLSEPIVLDGGPDDIDDVDLVDRNHRRVWEIGQRMLDDGLRRRRSLWFG